MRKLTDSEEEILKEVRAGDQNGRVVIRAIIIRARANNHSAVEIANILKVSPRTVYNIEDKFEKEGIVKALHDEPRSGRPKIFKTKIETTIAAIACSAPPEEFDRWSLSLLRDKVLKDRIVGSISKEKIRIILKEHNIKPWLQKCWCIPDLNEEYIEKMEDILGVYERPTRKEYPLVCIDEKPMQLLSDARPGTGVFPGEIAKQDYEYVREGTANVFCAVAPYLGEYTNQVTERRTKDDFAKFLKKVESKYQDAKKIILVMDNLNTHGANSLIGYYGEKKGLAIWNHFEIHYTPKHGSWLNMAEISINMLSRQCYGRTRIPDINTLRDKTKKWNKYINSKRTIINWEFTVGDAREKLNYKKK
jgi:transposase